jgi:CubicO group peptidase (beta-lactamase class C family)
VLERAFAEPGPEGGRRTRAVVVVHRGRIVAEGYSAGIGPGTPLPGWSMAKSVMNALVGILVKEGRLSLEAPVRIREWQGPGDPRRGITLDHLLRMSSGLRFDDDVPSPRGDVTRMLLGSGRADMASYAAGKEAEAMPGTAWKYTSGTTILVARVIRGMMGDDAEYLAFPRAALFGPIGMATAHLETDAAGTFVGSSFLYASARDWARFGMLYLQDGVWEGQRILPEGWVGYTQSPAPADPEGRYGAHFWLKLREEDGGASVALPPGSFHAAGHQGQYVTIVPSREAVIVRLGVTRHAGVWNQAAFVRDVLAALPP